MSNSVRRCRGSWWIKNNESVYFSTTLPLIFMNISGSVVELFSDFLQSSGQNCEDGVPNSESKRIVKIEKNSEKNSEDGVPNCEQR